MKIPQFPARKLHLALFALAICIQIAVLYLSFRQPTTTVTETYLHKENNALSLSNRALNHYFEADNAFLEYLNEFSPDALKRFDASIDSLKSGLADLNNLSTKDYEFGKAVESKRKTSSQVAGITKELDSLLQIRSKQGEIQWQTHDFEMKGYDFDRVLASVKYDSIKFSEEAMRKNILKRLGDAIRGRHNLKREELRIYMTMVFENGPKKGSFEDQMKNLYKDTQTFYNGEFQRLRSTYSQLRGKDGDMLGTNREILKKAQELLNVYLKSAQESETVRLAKTYSKERQDRLLLAVLLQGLVVVTVGLMLYSWSRYRHEDELASGKKKAEESLQFKRRILGMLSHEMRAPLRIMGTIAEQLLQENKDKNLEKNLALMHFTSKSLQITAGQILEFFKKRQATLTAFNGRINLEKELTDILDSLRLLAANKNLELHGNLSGDMKQWVLVDNGKIHQLFYNIIGNAIKFTENGSITVDGDLSETDGKMIFSVSIADTGEGIPQEDIQKIFEEFYQSGHHSGQISFGAGLGLNLCKEIIDLYDGKISVESELGKGTKISFYLILDKADDPQSGLRNQILEKTKDHPLEIAAFDDDPIALSIIQKLASDMKATMEKAATFSDSMALAKTGTFNLAIVDMNISGLSGLEIIRSIRWKENPNHEAIILAITGDNYTDFEDIKESGADALLIKPVNKGEFYTRILEALNDKSR